ncbi:hypothetical protein LguiA_025519 [Lonicera macranthoides]
MTFAGKTIHKHFFYLPPFAGPTRVQNFQYKTCIKLRQEGFRSSLVLYGLGFDLSNLLAISLIILKLAFFRQILNSRATRYGSVEAPAEKMIDSRRLNSKRIRARFVRDEALQ